MIFVLARNFLILVQCKIKRFCNLAKCFRKLLRSAMARNFLCGGGRQAAIDRCPKGAKLRGPLSSRNGPIFGLGGCASRPIMQARRASLVASLPPPE
jgi:hypothetical protein